MDTSKIIKGVVNSGRYTVTAPIVKEDYGLYLKIEGLELPSTYEVDFSNSESNGTSVTMIGNADGVLIPRQFISSGKDVFAFLYHVGEDFGRTIYKFRIPNKVRPDRTEEQPTPEEQSVIDQAISALNDAVTRTAQDVIDADASAQSASQSAENAHDSAVDAQNYAESASGYASDAQGYATTASQKATAASQSEEAARGYAQTASDKADSITGLTATAATLEAGSSATASYADGVLTLGIPRGAGGDDGYSPTVSVTEITGGHRVAITDKAGTKNFDVMNGDDYILTEEDKEEIADMVEIPSDWLKAFPTDIASGAVASFTDGADGLPLKSLIVDINPVQDLSNGDPSPENICPISGWTQVEVNHSDADMTNPTTITIDLGQTVYGGKLDVLSGVLTVDRVIVSVASVMNKNEDANGYYWYSTTTTLGVPNISELNAELISDRFVKRQAVSTSANEGTITFYANNIIRWKERGDLALADYRTYLALNPFQLCYELAEPIIIQLTPHEVNSLLGVNNIFADTGDAEVEYRADTKLYIERLTAPDSADMIADANIQSGKYFMVGNSLYKATANIANGASIVVGTNCIRKSLSEALNEINA